MRVHAHIHPICACINHRIVIDSPPTGHTHKHTNRHTRTQHTPLSRARARALSEHVRAGGLRAANVAALAQVYLTFTRNDNVQHAPRLDFFSPVTPPPRLSVRRSECNPTVGSTVAATAVLLFPLSVVLAHIARNNNTNAYK